MFMTLYLVTAALALLLLPTQPQGDNHTEHFSFVPKHINETTFPVNLNVNSSSNMILVKCPSKTYKYKNDNDSFFLDDKIGDLFFNAKTDNDLAFWTPVIKNSYGTTSFTCGMLSIKQGPFDAKQYYWTYNVKWNNSSNLQNVKERKEILSGIPPLHDNCDVIEEETLIFSANKDNIITKINEPKVFQDTEVNQLFYYFKKTEIKDKDIYQKSCGIYQAYYHCPTITLQGDNPKKIDGNSMKYVEVNGLNKTVKVKLMYATNEKYYKGEKITLTRKRFLRNGVKAIRGSMKIITSKFSFRGFDLIELNYTCPREKNTKVISETFYFGPTSLDYKPDMEKVAYVKEDNKDHPNCYMHWLNVGYLDEIINGDEKMKIDINSLNNGGNTKWEINESKDRIILKDIKNRITNLQCVYKTPYGKATFTREFTEGIEVITGKHSDGKPIIEIDTTDPNMKKELEELRKSWFQKLESKVGRFCAIFIVVICALLLITCIGIPVICIYINLLNPYLKALKCRKRYPNVYNFWNDLLSESLEKYIKQIKEEKYLSDKLKKRKVIKKLEGGEEVDIGVSYLFDSSLVGCYKHLGKKIRAHYVYNDPEKRQYILSDGPTQDTLQSFWQMLYDENITTVIAIMYDKKEDSNDKTPGKEYWPKIRGIYGNMTVTCRKELGTKILSVDEYDFKIEKKNAFPKYVRLYHVCSWKEHDIPQSDLQFYNIYENIISQPKNKNILIHSSDRTGSRVYMFTYFACILDSITSSNDIDDPLEVIKEIRNNRYGGNIGLYEFAYVIKAIVTTLFNRKILLNVSQQRIEFNSSYEDYFYNYMTRQSRMNNKLKQFLTFINVLDSGKIDEYEINFGNVGDIPTEELKKRCERFIEVKKTVGAAKLRYFDIICYDTHAVTIGGKPTTDISGFIHANKFVYTTNEGKERKLIMCQAPLETTKDDMLDMIFRYKVSIVVVLVKPDESPTKWINYFPIDNNNFVTDNYVVKRIFLNNIDKDQICESQYVIINNNDRKEFKFTILHYQGWPDKSVPEEHMSIYGLYKKIISYNSKDFIAIHCSAGIGRTGTLALIIYLIDTINLFPTFDPLGRLRFLREHRWGAVQKYNQFLFALLVVFEHFKKDIKDMDVDAYKEFYKCAHAIFKRDGCFDKKK